MNFKRFEDGDIVLEFGRLELYLIHTKYNWGIGVGFIISPPSGAIFSFGIDLLCFTLGGHFYRTKQEQKW